MLVVSPDSQVPEVFAREGAAMARLPEATIPALGVRLTVIDGPRLRVTWESGSAQV